MKSRGKESAAFHFEPFTVDAEIHAEEGVQGFCPDKNYGAVFSALTPGYGAVVPETAAFPRIFYDAAAGTGDTNEIETAAP